jgi:NTP pyrophosphatase (non-canonical NTP hydrolase)
MLTNLYDIAKNILDPTNARIFTGRTDEFYYSLLQRLASRIIDKPYAEIYAERDRQESLKVSGKFFWTCADKDVSHQAKLAVLAEEFGETAREVVDYDIGVAKYNVEKLEFPPHRKLYFLKRIRKELIQVAAVCVAWCEAIDKEIGESLDSGQ